MHCDHCRKLRVLLRYSLFYALIAVVLQGGRSLGLTMYSLFFHLASISLAAAALIHAPLPSTTAPAVLRRQNSASGASSDYVTVGYLVIGTLDDTTACMLINCES